MKRYTGKTATAIIPFPDDKILLVKRDTVPFKGYWALPGGRMDPGEKVEQTIVRECKEETGLDVEVVRVIGEYVEKGTKDDVDYEYYPTCFLVKVVGGEIKRQESEIQEIRLFRLKRLPNQLAFEHQKMIEDYLNTKIIGIHFFKCLPYLQRESLKSLLLFRVSFLSSKLSEPSRTPCPQAASASSSLLCSLPKAR